MSNSSSPNTENLLSFSEGIISANYYGPGFVKPAYESRLTFASVPGFIEQLLLGSTSRPTLPIEVTDKINGQINSEIDRVVLVLFDALGWEAVTHLQAESQLLKDLFKSDLSLKTTSQFPSTTAAHVTSLSSGLPVYASGVCEWRYYEPKVNQIINPFYLSPYHTAEKELLIKGGRSTAEILPQHSFTNDLEEDGVACYWHNPFPSQYGLHFHAEHVQQPYHIHSPETAVQRILESLKKIEGKQFHSLYLPTYDSLRHEQGPYSHNADQEGLYLLKTLEPLFYQQGDGRTLVMLTADHGQVAINPAEELFINQEIPDLLSYLRRSKSGEILRYGGGPRDILLYVQPEKVIELAGLLRERFKGIAEIYTQAEAAQLGTLGPLPILPDFAARMGDLLILPHLNYSIAWDEPGFRREIFRGHHGGLTTQEMETPLFMVLV